MPLTVLIRDLAFGPADAPDIGTPQPVTNSTVPMPSEHARKQPPAAEEAAINDTIVEEMVKDDPFVKPAAEPSPPPVPPRSDPVD